MGVAAPTLWHGPSADVSSHAAALQICGMVAGHYLDLITGEMVQVGDDGRLLREHLQLHLSNETRAQYLRLHTKYQQA